MMGMRAAGRSLDDRREERFEFLSRIHSEGEAILSFTH